jgi:predicted AAA+ superfamily ATPase
VSDYKLFEKVLNFLSQNIWSISSLRKVENYLKKDKMSLSLNTISNYIKYLQNCFIINECERFDILGKKTLEYNSKYYFNDLWIRNSLYLNWKMDIWKLLENFIYNMLLKNWYEVFVWNLKDKEIDFIAKKDNKIKYFQICYLLSDDIREREYWNLEKIVDNWEKFVISMDDVDFWVSEWIKHIQAWKLENIL